MCCILLWWWNWWLGMQWWNLVYCTLPHHAIFRQDYFEFWHQKLTEPLVQSVTEKYLTGLMIWLGTQATLPLLQNHFMILKQFLDWDPWIGNHTSWRDRCSAHRCRNSTPKYSCNIPALHEQWGKIMLFFNQTRWNNVQVDTLDLM